MHAVLMPNGRVVFLDKVEDYTHLNLSNGQFAYSAEYDPATNAVVPLAYQTNAFRTGGAFLANGTLLSVGGGSALTSVDPTIHNGFRALRYLTRSSEIPDYDGQDWVEPGHRLDTPRWYATAQTLSNGSVLVASGSLNGGDPVDPVNNNPTFEILDPDGVSRFGSIAMPLLVKAQPYHMYPFLHLLPTGDLFVFASKSCELFSVTDLKTTKDLPELAGDYRTFPNTAGSVLLPMSSANNWAPSIIVCGGGAYQDITSPTDPSCGRIDPLADDPKWEMDGMPEGRSMVDGTLLPDGTVLWLNGVNTGAQGVSLATDPTTEALLYNPAADFGQRWTRDARSYIPRLYNSVALLLLDGTVMVAGSNPSSYIVLEPFKEQPYPTEFRVEIFTPSYLVGDRARYRPANIKLGKLQISAQDDLDVDFTCAPNATTLKIALYHGGFVTHSLHMGQRMLYLDSVGFNAGSTTQRVTASMPGNPNLTPPGPYVVFVVVDGVPGVGQFVNVLANSAATSAVSVDEDSATQTFSLPPVGPVSLATSSDIDPATALTTTFDTTPEVPYSNGSVTTCTDYPSAPATTNHSNTNTISFWPLPTICFDTPTLCGTGPFPWTVHLNKTSSPRMVSSVAQTVHPERPQGFLAPPDPQLTPTPLQTGYVGSMGSAPNHSIPLSTGPVRMANKVPVAQLMAPTQDPQAARLERPALNLDIPQNRRVRRVLPSNDLAPEVVPMEVNARAKIPKPQPQTARAMATGAGDLGGPQLDALDNGHPVDAGSSPVGLGHKAELAALLDPREEDEQTAIQDVSSATVGVGDVQSTAYDRGKDTATATDSIWDSRANHKLKSADSSVMALMATILSALVLVMIL